MFPKSDTIKLFILFYIIGNVCCGKKPNIIMMIADDMGWNDVGIHGSGQIRTPNIDALAYNGVTMKNHYSQALCTPSRAALLTGKYPIHTGMQHLVILEPEPWGLPLEETVLPEYLKEEGYMNYAIGKWHLGYHKSAYTPLKRGFDKFFGYYNGLQDYWNHTVHATFADMLGFDMRRDWEVDYSTLGKYSTHLFTDEAIKIIHEHKDSEKPMFLYISHLAPHSGNTNDPMQAPDEEIAKYANISDPDRRVYAAMVSELDKSVGQVVAALRETKQLDDSIIVFISDNGAQTFGIHANHGSNYPLRGLKGGPWEGSAKTMAAIWSPKLKKPQRVFTPTMHITDWLPTLWAAAGLDPTKLGDNLDGMNLWNAISEDQKSPRTDMVYNIDDIDNYAAIRRGDWKYLIGSVLKGKQDGWYGESGREYDYDMNLVLNSQVNVALAGETTEQQIRQKNQANSGTTTTSFPTRLLTEERISEMRKELNITCGDEDDGSVYHVCDPLQSPCLINLRNDPCERRNVAHDNKMIALLLENELLRYRRTMLPPRNVVQDERANPKYWNNVWVSWVDCEEVAKEKIMGPLSSTAIALLAVFCLLFFIVAVVLTSVSVKSSQQKKSKKDMEKLAAQDDSFDAPAGVVHVMTETDKPEHFQSTELSRHHSLTNHSKSIY